MRQVVLLLALLLIPGGFASTQTDEVRHHTPPPESIAQDPQFGQHRNPNPDERRMERERVKRLNKERQATIQRDTDKLLALATELKQYVDKTNENVLSLDVLKKAEEIKKLAHQVKEKMKAGQ